MFARPEDERNEDELIAAVKPLLIQAEKALQQTQGAIKGADPEKVKITFLPRSVS